MKTPPTFLALPPKTRPRVFLLDGHALLYRAFYALITHPMRTAAGENTSAIWGVTNFILRLTRRHDPDGVIWVGDAGDSLRRTIYPAYKATREKLAGEMLTDFQQGERRAAELCAALGIPVGTVPGYEADDVIATLAQQAVAAGWEAVIVSGDKDFHQCVGPHVALLNPGRGGPAAVEEHWVDHTTAHERLGVPASQVVDYLALVGDASDNVPGIPGIGPKTAIILLQTYGSLEGILAAANQVKGKKPREALLAHADQGRMSQRLTQMITNVPVTFDPAAAQVQPMDEAAMTALLEAVEFTSIARRLNLLPVLESAPALPPVPTGPPPVAPAWFSGIDL